MPKKKSAQSDKYSGLLENEHWIQKQKDATSGHLRTHPNFTEFFRNYKKKDSIAENEDLFKFHFDKEYVYFIAYNLASETLLVRQSIESFLEQSEDYETLVNCSTLNINGLTGWDFKKISTSPDGTKAALTFELTTDESSDYDSDSSSSSEEETQTCTKEFSLTDMEFIEDGFTLSNNKIFLCWLDNSSALTSGIHQGSETNDDDNSTDSQYEADESDYSSGDDSDEDDVLNTTDELLIVENNLTTVRSIKSLFPFRIDEIYVHATLIEENDDFFTLIEAQFDDFNTSYGILNKDVWGLEILPIPENSKFCTALGTNLIFSLIEFDEQVNETCTVFSFNLKEYLINPNANPITPLVISQSIKRQTINIDNIVASKDYLVIPFNQDLNVHYKIIDLTDFVIRTFKTPIGYTYLKPFASGWHNHLGLRHYSFITNLQFDTLNLSNLSLNIFMKNINAFPSRNLSMSYHLANSQDGTKVPYFMVYDKRIKFDGNRPTLLNGYGGFNTKCLPFYDASLVLNWLSKGGVFVLSCLRGGSEFGRKWHLGAIDVNKPRSFEDFIAVSEALIANQITKPNRLVIEGTSNGGLLTATCAISHPHLYNGAVSSYPMLSMCDYPKYEEDGTPCSEYGDPNNPQTLKVLKSYSPFDNIAQKNGKTTYPKMLLFTAHDDTTVSPEHAVRFTKKFQDMGHDCLLFVFNGGGHAGGNSKKLATEEAMRYSFIHEQASTKGKRCITPLPS